MSSDNSKQKNQTKSTIYKKNDILIETSSPIPNFANSSNKLQDLTTEIINQLLNKTTALGCGATSTVFKVKNIYTNNGYLCLKILKSEVFKKINREEEEETENNEKLTWTDDDDNDDDFEKSSEKIQIDMDIIRQLLKEYEILNIIDHPNIVKVYGFFRGDQIHNPAILLEYCKYNLEQAVKRLDDFYLVSVVYEICSAMKYVHAKKLIHRDLKAKNILVNFEKHVKICDFGIARAMDLTTLRSFTHGVGTLAFMAPEIINDEAKYTDKVDVYSFGVVMYYVVMKGKMPKFNGVGNYINLKMPEKINQVSQRMIKACWAMKPEERPSFEELLETIVKENFKLIDGIEEKIPELKSHLGLD